MGAYGTSVQFGNIYISEPMYVGDEMDTPILDDVYNAMVQTSGYSMDDGGNIGFGTTTGTKIGTSSTQKIAFYGATPVVKPSAVSSPTGGIVVDSQARSAIDNLISWAQSLGLMST